MDRVYFDTSFFIGLLENQKGRRAEAEKILAYEAKSTRFTSELTICEFLVGVYDKHKHQPDCEDFVREVEDEIRSIAGVAGISGDIHKTAARLQSTYGEIHKHGVPKEPRDRKFRWDAIHIATAKELNCKRIYAWDGKWESLPKEIKSGLGDVIAPALCPVLNLFDNDAESVAEASPEEGPAPAAESSTPVEALTAEESAGNGDETEESASPEK